MHLPTQFTTSLTTRGVRVTTELPRQELEDASDAELAMLLRRILDGAARSESDAGRNGGPVGVSIELTRSQ